MAAAVDLDLMQILEVTLAVVPITADSHLEMQMTFSSNSLAAETRLLPFSMTTIITISLEEHKTTQVNSRDKEANKREDRIRLGWVWVEASLTTKMTSLGAVLGADLVEVDPVCSSR